MIELIITFCILAVFLLGYVIGWIRGQKSMMPIIKDYKEVSISVALEYFNKSPIEETLTKLFELVDTTFLLRKRLR